MAGRFTLTGVEWGRYDASSGRTAGWHDAKPDMSIIEVCQWLQDTEVGTQIRESVWTFPILEGTHLLTIAISVGTLLVMDLRLAGLLFTRWKVSDITKAVMPISIFGFTVMFITGIFLFLSQAVKAYGSIYFKLKILFLVLAGVNALVFELTMRNKIHEWDADAVPPWRARMAGICGMILWAGVIAAGRTMAYNF